jgi:hypothetical protein
LFVGGAGDGDGSIEPVGSLARGAVWVAARSDTTEDLEPAAIFGHDSGPPAPEDQETGTEF